MKNGKIKLGKKQGILRGSSGKEEGGSRYHESHRDCKAVRGEEKRTIKSKKIFEGPCRFIPLIP